MFRHRTCSEPGRIGFPFPQGEIVALSRGQAIKNSLIRYGIQFQRDHQFKALALIGMGPLYAALGDLRYMAAWLLVLLATEHHAVKVRGKDYDDAAVRMVCMSLALTGPGALAMRYAKQVLDLAIINSENLHTFTQHFPHLLDTSAGHDTLKMIEWILLGCFRSLIYITEMRQRKADPANIPGVIALAFATVGVGLVAGTSDLNFIFDTHLVARLAKGGDEGRNQRNKFKTDFYYLSFLFKP